MSEYACYDHLPDPVLVVNLRGEIQYFNNQATIFFRLPPRLLRNKQRVLQFCDSADFDLEDWLAKGFISFDVQTSPEVKLYLPHDPEAEYHVVLRLIPVSSTGSGQGFAVHFHDRTVEKTLHSKYREQLEELKKTHNQFLQADKLNTLGELTANISHEINNPLTIAAGHAEIISDFLKMASPEKRLPQIARSNEAVIESLERVNQIIKNMKDFLHQSQDEKEYCDLEALIDHAIEWINPTAQKVGVEIRKDIGPARMAILANKIKLEQVLINLVKNSIDAITEKEIKGGEIVIAVRKSKDNQQISIDVIDNGPGIPPKIMENLFRPFTSTKEAGYGTGLGLSICSKIVETHQGKLEHLPTETGCHFRLRLPMVEIYSYSQNDRSLAGSAREKRILVLDNEVQILNVMNSFLRSEHLVFIGSSQPEDALGFLGKAQIDLIITDFSMPTMNGGEFSQRAREAGYQGPILYMTSAKFIDQYNKDKNLLEISGIIVKPFNRQEVMKTIHSALKKREAA